MRQSQLHVKGTEQQLRKGRKWRKQVAKDLEKLTKDLENSEKDPEPAHHLRLLTIKRDFQTRMNHSQLKEDQLFKA